MFPLPFSTDEITAPPMPMPMATAMTPVCSGNATLMPASPASPTALPTKMPSNTP